MIDLFASLIFKSKAVKKSLYFCAFSLVLFFSQNYTSSVGERYKLPLFNTIVGRISQNEANVRWFEKEGMPLSEIITKDFKEFNIDDDYNTRALVYSKYKDVSYKPLFNWILKDGKLVYQKFLITNPSYFFLRDQTDTETHRVFCTTLLEYIQKPEGFYLLADGTFPYFSPLLLFICLIILSGLYYYRKHKILLFPFMLIVLCILNALISYNADALEVKRHLFNTQIIIDFVGILSLIFILNELMIIYKNSSIYLRSKNKCLFKN